jgi:hypothetical protein
MAIPTRRELAKQVIELDDRSKANTIAVQQLTKRLNKLEKPAEKTTKKDK